MSSAGRTGTKAGASAAASEPVVDPVPEIRAKAVAETRRIAAIRKICDGRFGEIEEKAITEGWSPEKCELHVLRAGRPKAPAVHVIDNTLDGHVLEAACLPLTRRSLAKRAGLLRKPAATGRGGVSRAC